VAALNRQQMEWVVDRPVDADAMGMDAGHGPGALGPEPAGFGVSSATCWPRNPRERGQLLAQLETQFRLGGEARRQAMAIGAAWGHRAALPLLRRGLRDTDPDVMALAAGAMERFRRGSVSRPQPAAKAPRNVSRTR
jgi:HEAT repeat protein